MASTLNKTYSINDETVQLIRDCARIQRSKEAYALRQAVAFYHKYLIQQNGEIGDGGNS